MKHNYFVLLIIFFICSFPLFSQIQIVNEGVLQIKPSTIVYFGNVYINEGVHNNDGVLYLKGDFENNAITSAAITSTTHFTGSATIQEIRGSANKVNFYNMVINNTYKGVSVVDGFELNVTNIISLSAGDLRLVGEAQLLQLNDVANTGHGKLLRDQQGISSSTGYNYWSSPINNGGTFALNGGLFDGTDATINSFSPMQIGFNSGSPYNGVSAIIDGSGNVTTPLKINERWLYTYSPNTAGYAGWDKIYQNSPIKPGEGFTMKGTGSANQNYVFKGAPNNGTYSFSISSGQSTLLGNPYPSALDADKFITKNLSIFDQIEFWVDGGSPSHYLADYLGAYSIYNFTTGVSASVPSEIAGGGGAELIFPTQFIAVAQGFFVEADSPGTIVFENSQRAFQTENISDSNFYKRANTKSEQKTNPENKSIIRIGYEDPEKFHRQLALGFVPNSSANLNYNRGYDAVMSGPRDDELFFIIEKDFTKKYVIQGVNTFDENNEFDLGLIIKEAGEHTIMLDAVENFKGKVYIKDVLANITHDLSSGNFKPMLPPGTYLDRFKIVFKEKYASVVNEDLVTAVNASAKNTTVYYHENESLIVRTKNDLKVNNITIYNILGQQIKQVIDSELSKNVFAIPFQYPKGVYLVIVESELGKEVFKIINK